MESKRSGESVPTLPYAEPKFRRNSWARRILGWLLIGPIEFMAMGATTALTEQCAEMFFRKPGFFETGWSDIPFLSAILGLIGIYGLLFVVGVILLEQIFRLRVIIARQFSAMMLIATIIFGLASFLEIRFPPINLDDQAFALVIFFYFVSAIVLSRPRDSLAA